MWASGVDHTLFAKITGTVKFSKRGAEQRMYVHVVPEAAGSRDRTEVSAPAVADLLKTPAKCRGFCLSRPLPALSNL